MREFLISTARTAVAAVTAALVVVLVLAVVYGKRSAEERDAIDQIRRGTLATVCVLALPVDNRGRDPEAVERCLRRFGIEP